MVESTSPSEAEPIAAVEHLEEVEGVVEQAAVVERGAPSSRPRLVKTSTMSSTLTSRLAKKCENLSSANQISKLMKNPKISSGHPFVQISPSDSFQLHRRTFQISFLELCFTVNSFTVLLLLPTYPLASQHHEDSNFNQNVKPKKNLKPPPSPLSYNFATVLQTEHSSDVFKSSKYYRVTSCEVKKSLFPFHV